MERSTQSPWPTRQHDRAELDTYINKIVGDEPHLARVRDISTGGVFLYKLIEPETRSDEPVGLELKLPHSDEIIWVIGEVVRAETRDGVEGVGVRFVHIADQDRQMIADYVAAKRSKAKPRSRGRSGVSEVAGF